MSNSQMLALILCNDSELNSDVPAVTACLTDEQGGYVAWHDPWETVIYHHLIQELPLDGAQFQAFFRLTKQQFQLVYTCLSS